MKCDIILDLLPLYVEDLCRPESKKAVTDHLADCPSCRVEYEKLFKELLPVSADTLGSAGTPSSTGTFSSSAAFGSSGADAGFSAVPDMAAPDSTSVREAEIALYLEEKNLFQKSRDAVRASLFERICRGTELTVFVLALLCNLAAAAFVIFGYNLRYPKLYFGELGAAQVWILVAALLPTLLSLAGVAASYKKNRNHLLRLAPKVIFWLLIPAILIGALGTACFLIVPPLCSGTDRTGHYLVLDSDMEPYADSLAELFPEQIPEQAVARTYHYQKYSSLFSDSMIVECSFRLTDDEYEAAKTAALKSRCFRNLNGEGGDTKAGGSKAADQIAAETTPPSGDTLSTTLYPENLKVVFTYDDDSHTVYYRAEMDKKR